MKLIKKAIMSLMIVLSVSLPITTMATPIEIEPLVTPCSIEDNSTYSSDTIEYVYRVYEGKLQYRRWNATKGYWIDATWLDA